MSFYAVDSDLHKDMDNKLNREVKVEVTRMKIEGGIVNKHTNVTSKDPMEEEKNQIIIQASKRRPYKCQECSYSFTFQGNLSRHRKTAHKKGPKGRTWKCAQCPSRFSSIKYANYHENQVHKRKYHPRKTENADTAVECNICGKEFIHIYSLAVHMYQHNQTKGPFKCFICNKMSSFRHNAARHLRLQHGWKMTIERLKLFKPSFNYTPKTPALWEKVAKQLRPCKVILTRCDPLTLTSQCSMHLEKLTSAKTAAKTFCKSNQATDTSPSKDYRNKMQPECKCVQLERKQIYKCPYCFQSFWKAQLLINHLSIHARKKGST